MDAQDVELDVSKIAAAIGEPARARILFCLLDGRARTGTELTVVANVSSSTASVHLFRLKEAHLIQVVRQGRNCYYSLRDADVASALESLSVLAGASREQFCCRTPEHLRAARSCYDHLAGGVGVSILERFESLNWLSIVGPSPHAEYSISLEGREGFASLGIDVDAARSMRRQFASACLDWSERRFHLGGSLGAALLTVARKRIWVIQDLDSRALRITSSGRRELLTRLGISL